MSSIPLSKIFGGEYLRIITNYCNTIQQILNSYDTAVFMARKAICFYQSMVINKLITPTKCEIVSSRVLDYNILYKFADRKIAIIDDVVVKGVTLDKVLSEFSRNNLSADVYVAACEEKIAAKLLNNTSHTISKKFVYLDASEIYLFSGLITEYIELSMCPFNIDQPIYEASSIYTPTIFSTLGYTSYLNITSGLQKKYDITSKVFYFRYDFSDDATINSILQNSILKIRLLYNKDRIIALPFVLFPELSLAELNLLYEYIMREDICDLLYSDNDYLFYENKLNFVSSFFSDLLFKDVFGDNYFERCNYIDYYQFFFSTSQVYGSRLESLLENSQNRKTSIVSVDFDSFSFPEHVGSAMKHIAKIDINKQLYYNHLNKKVDDIIITYDFLNDKLAKTDIHWYEVSSIVDVLIDRGMIVPFIVHTNQGIIRAYKLGEYSKLTRVQLEAFVAMLYKYQTLINNNLGKIEFEKLCVLFFNQGIRQKIFDQQTEYDEDCYSICYSLYGPRVSDSDKVYRVASDSALITDFLENELIRKQNNTYCINPLFVRASNYDLERFAVTFALQYSMVRKLFDQVKQQEKEERATGNNKTLWNQYVHTYSQYLTLCAVGNSRKNQFLSLCAELFQVTLIDDTFFDFSATNRKRINKIISGINSGLWKYFCYKNDALNKTNFEIYKKSETVAAVIGSSMAPVREDRNPALDMMIDEAGGLLFNVAFFINNVVQKLNKMSYFSDYTCMESELAEDTSDYSKNIFSVYYYKLFVDERHSIEENVKELYASAQYISEYKTILASFRQRCRFILDYCELFLTSVTPEYDCFKKMIVLYAPKKNLPTMISNTTEIVIEKVTSPSECKVFILPDRETGNSILTNLLNETFDLENIHYLVFDMKIREEGAVQICDQAKGTFLTKLITSELSFLRNKPADPTKQMTFIKSMAVESFNRGSYQFIHTNSEPITHGYVRTTLDIVNNTGTHQA